MELLDCNGHYGLALQNCANKITNNTKDLITQFSFSTFAEFNLVRNSTIFS